MKKGRKPFENKKDIDAGRLRDKVVFEKETYVPDQWGGGSVELTTVLSTVGLKENVSLNALGQMQQLGIIGGESDFTSSVYLTIRKRNGFAPEKDMQIKINGMQYTFRGFLPLDEPTTFIKILCSRTSEQK